MRPLFFTCKINLSKSELFTDEKDKLRTTSTEKDSMHKLTIDHSLNMRQFGWKMMQVALAISSNSLPAKRWVRPSQKNSVCIQDPLKCPSKRHNNHIHDIHKAPKRFLQKFSYIQYSQSQNSLYKWESISIYRSLKYIIPRSKMIKGQDHKIISS